MNLNELAMAIHDTSVEHGFWGDTNPRNFGEVCALIHSEVSEALEEYRRGEEPAATWYRHKNGMQAPNLREGDRLEDFEPHGIPVEFADIIIRVLDACAGWGIDIDTALRMKMEYNKSRPYKHGKRT